MKQKKKKKGGNGNGLATCEEREKRKGDSSTSRNLHVVEEVLLVEVQESFPIDAFVHELLEIFVAADFQQHGFNPQQVVHSLSLLFGASFPLPLLPESLATSQLKTRQEQKDKRKKEEAKQ
jgi:hypothetical protein